MIQSIEAKIKLGDGTEVTVHLTPENYGALRTEIRNRATRPGGEPTRWAHVRLPFRGVSQAQLRFTSGDGTYLLEIVGELAQHFECERKPACHTLFLAIAGIEDCCPACAPKIQRIRLTRHWHQEGDYWVGGPEQQIEEIRRIIAGPDPK